MVCTPLILLFSFVTLGCTQDYELQQTPPITVVSRATTEQTGSTTAETETTSSVRRALAWLITQREDDWGWRNDTPKVLTALQIAAHYDPPNPTLPTHLEMQLSHKQMDVEVVVLLWRHHEVPIAPPKLSEYALALSALCRDPRQFHGHDLIGTLEHREAARDLDFAHATLAACSARAHVRKKQIRRLLDVANAAKDHGIDTVAMTILALKCIVKDHRHRNLQHFLRRPSVGLARQQQDDGGFGNVYNTALTMQALQDMGDLNSHWNKTAARAYIESKQDPDGAFTDPGLTADVILALTKKGLGAIRSLDCGRGDADLENHVELDGLTKSLSVQGNDSEIRNVTITYTLWVGTNVTENATLAIVVPRNTSFYNVMQIAMETDPRFTFEASEWPNGHYVHTLAGYKEEPMGYNYWLLYRLPEMPDPLTPPANQLVAPVGVDDLLIEEGDHFLFWYKKL